LIQDCFIVPSLKHANLPALSAPLSSPLSFRDQPPTPQLYRITMSTVVPQNLFARKAAGDKPGKLASGNLVEFKAGKMTRYRCCHVSFAC
jgi:hypothetical protein